MIAKGAPGQDKLPRVTLLIVLNALLGFSPAAAEPAKASLESFSVTALYEALVAEPQKDYGCRRSSVSVLRERERLKNDIETRTSAIAIAIRQRNPYQHFDEIDRRSQAGEYDGIIIPSTIYPCTLSFEAEEFRRFRNLVIVLEEFERRAK